MDLFLLIKNERLTLLMDWMMAEEGERLEALTYVGVFKGMRDEWEKVKVEMAAHPTVQGAEERGEEGEGGRDDGQRPRCRRGRRGR